MKGTEIQKAVAAQPQKKPQTIRDYVSRMEGEIKKALPSVMTPERFTRITLSALSTTPQLNECTPASFLGAMMTAAQLGLEPNTPLGQAYLLPFRNNRKGCVECQFQLGYKGLIDLAYRSGAVSTIQAHVVYENDEFEYQLGLDPTIRHKPAMTNRGAAIAYYAVFRTKDGGFGFEVMSRQNVEAHARKYSKAYNNGPWRTNFDEMAKKTVLKRALKYAPLSTDFVRGLSTDETVHDTISADMMAEPVTFAEPETVDAEYAVVDGEPAEPEPGAEGGEN